MQPSLVVVADTVHTLVDPPKPAVEAVAVQDGRVVALGTRADVRAWRGRGTDVVDLAGATLTPGLVDGHSHPVMGVDLTEGIDLTDVDSLVELRTVLARAEQSLLPAEWLLGWGLDPNAFGGRPLSTRPLEDVLGDRPAVLRLFDAHGCLASPAALRLAGVTGPRDFGQEAEIVCDEADRPTGLLLESAAVDLVQALVPRADLDTRARRLLQVLQDMAATGLTAAHVMDAEGDSTAVLTRAEQLGELALRLRVAPWCMPETDAEEMAALVARQGTGGRRWQVRGVKLFMDGTVDNGTAWLHEPDTLGESTASFWPDPQAYARAVGFLAAAGVPTATHAIGDRAVAHVLDSLRGAPGAVRHRIEHLETLPRRLTGELASQGVVASMQPLHCSRYTRADQSDNWSSRLGPERAGRAWPMRDLRDAGVCVVLGSDWPVASFDARAGLAEAQLRRRSGRPQEKPVGREQALTARMALEGYTTQPAVAEDAPGRRGRLEVGAPADFTAFAVDPLVAPPDELAAAPIRLTVGGGRIIHQGG